MRGLAALLVLVGVAAPAWADERPRLGVEFRLGPFKPDISSDDAQRDYYGLVFSDEVDVDGALFDGTSGLERNRLLFNFELYYYVFDAFGLLGIGGSAGFWSIDGKTRICPDADDGSTCTPDTVQTESVRGNEPVSLSIFPLTLGVVYRFDEIKRRYAYVPFVPYVEGGVSYTFWRTTAGGSTSERPDGDGTIRGRGGQFGLYGTAGLAFNLDWIEPKNTQRARNTTGVLDSYLFFEGTISRADGFVEERIDFGDIYWQAGISLDFM